jgi:hypothetical protein
MQAIPPAQQAAEAQQANPVYTCADCGEAVVIFDGKTFKTCEHTDAAVLANMAAVVRGSGGLL